MAVAPARVPPSAAGPRMIPIITGLIMATNPGRTISRRAACVEISTQVALSGSTPSRPSNSPSISLNCLRISVIMSSAARPTDFIVMAATTNGRAPPISSPMTTSGSVKERSAASSPALVLYAANSAKAVKAALPIANPFPIAAVVFPMESSPSVMSRTSFPRPDISAIPPALSATGPYASTVIVTPTVPSIPIAAIAMPYKPASPPPITSLAP